jgi:hypothetical protein
MLRHPALSALLLLLLNGCSGDAPEAPQAGVTPTPAPPAVSDLREAPPAAAAPVEPITADATGTPKELEWDALIPDDYQPDKLLQEFQVEDLSDDDPRAEEFMARLKELWDKAPVREDLDGREIRLPGFVVPVEADEKETTGFLLVPYYGACVHVPPPPANQTVYVITEAGKGTRPELFDVIWVTGTISVKRIDNEIAEAGYTLYASDIAPYE